MFALSPSGMTEIDGMTSFVEAGSFFNDKRLKSINCKFRYNGGFVEAGESISRFILSTSRDFPVGSTKKLEINVNRKTGE